MIYAHIQIKDCENGEVLLTALNGYPHIFDTRRSVLLKPSIGLNCFNATKRSNCRRSGSNGNGIKSTAENQNHGENTTGIFSDMYFFKLPNKWEISLSNRRYFSNKNICYEGVGIPPDIKVSNTKDDLMTMTDPVLRAALDTLEKATQMH